MKRRQESDRSEMPLVKKSERLESYQSIMLDEESVVYRPFRNKKISRARLESEEELSARFTDVFL